MGKALRRAGFDLAAIRMTAGGWGDYVSTGKALARRSFDLMVSPLPSSDHRIGALSSILERAGETFSSSAMRRAWRIYQPYLQRNARGMMAVLDEGPRLMELLRARMAIAYEANSWLSSALLEISVGGGRKAVVVNHNSHARPGSAIGESVLGTMRSNRTDNELVTLAAQWSPQWKKWRGSRSEPFATANIPYRIAYPASPERNGGAFRVLHAGNYQNWSDFLPWIAETSDEYVTGIAELASAIGAMPEAELHIRVRSKREVTRSVVEELVPDAQNVTISNSESDFLGEMAASDLLVSHFSTTVEQALQMGKPVLLWGSTRRYCQFPPQWEPPTASSRSPVYAVRDAADLPAMLAAIQLHHMGRPLSDEEVAPFRNTADCPDIDGLARILASATPHDQRRN